MKVVWHRETATVREVCDALCQIKPTAYTTVLTLMGILEEKGALTHFRSGRAYVYRPLLTRQQATRNQMRDVLSRFFDGQPDRLIEDVVRNEVSDPSQLQGIVQMLQAEIDSPVA